LLQLKKNLEEFLLKENKYPVKKEDRPFHPHITIANRDLKKPDFSPAWEYFSKILYETFFMVNSISLLRSTADGWQIVEECTFAGS
jgi:2'-5' RNA ligase